jgi:hypothetical protein
VSRRPVRSPSNWPPRGAVISYHDPYIETWRINGTELASVDDLDAALAAGGLNEPRVYPAPRRLLDTRGALAPGPAVERL